MGKIRRKPYGKGYRKKQKWNTRYVIGRFDNESNRVFYLAEDRWRGRNWIRKLEFNVLEFKHSFDANCAVEHNKYDYCKLVKKDDERKYTLFVCKVFARGRGEKRELKLTKQTSYHLLEVVANNI